MQPHAADAGPAVLAAVLLITVAALALAPLRPLRPLAMLLFWGYAAGAAVAYGLTGRAEAARPTLLTVVGSLAGLVVVSQLGLALGLHHPVANSLVFGLEALALVAFRLQQRWRSS